MGTQCLLCARFLVLIVSSNRSPVSRVSKDTYTGYLNCFWKFQSKDDQSQILSMKYVMRYLCINVTAIYVCLYWIFNLNPVSARNSSDILYYYS